jgi:ubiquitin carboxyl-terminal hydrolase 34
MDLESAELSRERAVSSEPCSTRPNPFGEHEPSARKRQRVSSGGSRSRSVDATRESSRTLSSSPPPVVGSAMERISQPPQTPPHPVANMPATEPTSSRVTINLRSTRPPELSSSPPVSPTTPSRIVEQAADTKMSIEPLDEDVVPEPAVETPTTSSSPDGSPEIELVVSEDEEQTPPVAIIEDDELLLESDLDPMSQFPYSSITEPLRNVVLKIEKFLEYGGSIVPIIHGFQLTYSRTRGY